MKIRESNRNNPKDTVRYRKRRLRQKLKEFQREDELPGDKQRQIEKQKKEKQG